MTYTECLCPTKEGNCACLKKYKDKDFIISQLIKKYKYNYTPIIHMFHVCNYEELRNYFLHYKNFDIEEIY